MKHELRAMLPQASGSIVNVSSAYGSVGAAGASVYVASKHAVRDWTKSAALEVAGHRSARQCGWLRALPIRVCSPRFTNKMNNKAAAGLYRASQTPRDTGRNCSMIAFVAARQTPRTLTGASIPVDGGMLAD